MTFREIRSRGDQLRRERELGMAPTGSRPETPEEEEIGLAKQARSFAFGDEDVLGVFGDLLMAPLRGTEGFVRSVYGLADTVLFDTLPDYDERLLGTSQTGLGGLVENGTDFLLGFVPVVGWIGRGAQIGGAIGKAGKALRFVDKAGRLKGLRHLSDDAIAAASGRGLFGISPLAKSTHLNLRRAAVAGAVSDFAAFEGHEDRLSNLLVAAGGKLDNPVTQFLAADEDDPELLGRVKNSIEGLMLGTIMDSGIELTKGTVRAVRRMAEHTKTGVAAVKAGRRARDAGASPEEVDRAVSEVVESRAPREPDANVPEPSALQDFSDDTLRQLGLEDPSVLRDYSVAGAGSDAPTRAAATIRLTRGNLDRAEALVRAADLFAQTGDSVRAFDRAAAAAGQAWTFTLNRGQLEKVFAAEMGSEEGGRQLAAVLLDRARPELGDLGRETLEALDPSALSDASLERAARLMGLEGSAGRAEARKEAERLAKRLGWTDEQATSLLAQAEREGVDVSQLPEGESLVDPTTPRDLSPLLADDGLPLRRIRKLAPSDRSWAEDLPLGERVELEEQLARAADVGGSARQRVLARWRQRAGLGPAELPSRPELRQPKPGETPRDATGRRLISATGASAAVEENGQIRVFIRADDETAERILRGGLPDDEVVRASTDPAGTGSGSRVVSVTVDPEQVTLVRQHGDGVDVELSRAALAGDRSALRARFVPELRVGKPREGGRRSIIVSGKRVGELRIERPDPSGPAVLMDVGDADQRVMRHALEDAVQRVADEQGGVQVPKARLSADAVERIRQMPNVRELDENTLLIPGRGEAVPLRGELMELSGRRLTRALGAPSVPQVGRRRARGYVNPQKTTGYRLVPVEGGGWRLEGVRAPEGKATEVVLDAVERGATELGDVPKPIREAAKVAGFVEEDRVLRLPQALRDAPEQVRQRAGGEGRRDGGDARFRLLRRLVLDDQKAEELIASVENRIEDGLPSGINPRETLEDGTFRWSEAELLEMRLRRTDLNLSRFEGTEGALQLLRTYEELFRSTVDEGGDLSTLPRPITFEEQHAQALAELSDLAVEKNPRYMQERLMRGIEADNLQLRKLNARVLGYKAMLLTYAEHVAKLARAASSGGEKEVMEFARAGEVLADLTAGVKGLLAEQGRGLGANRIPIHELALDPDAMRAAVTEKGGLDNLRKLAQSFSIAYADGGAAGAAAATRLARATRGSVGKRVLIEYWMNSILSGLKTLTVNTLGNSLATVYLPLEKMVGGALSLNGSVVTDAAREMTYIFSNVSDGLRMARRAWLEERNFLDPHRSSFDVPIGQRAAITPETFDQSSALRKAGLGTEGWAAPGVRWLGGIVRFPSRSLMATDEFFKQINFRAKLKADLVRKNLDAGMRPHDAAAQAVDEMDQYFFQGQAYSRMTEFRAGIEDARSRGISDPDLQRNHASNYARENFDPQRSSLARRSLDRAEEATFTQELPEGSLSLKLQQAVNAHPFLRFFVPFVRTPVNLLRFAGQRYDAISAARVLQARVFPSRLKQLRASRARLVRDVLSGDPTKKAEALGRFAMGMGTGWLFLSWAAEGKITGRGPSNPEQQRILQSAGWAPYSFKIGDRYVSYRRLDPFSTMIGMAADLIGYGKWAPQEEQENLEMLMHGLGVSIANNFTQKSYLTGIANLVDALQAPDEKLGRVVSGFAGSFVPSFFAQGVSLPGDDAMREVRSAGDAMAARLPFFSDDLDPVRNVLGEEVKRVRSIGHDTIGSIMDAWMPIAYRDVEDDVIFNEMAELNHGFSPPRYEHQGVNLKDFRTASGHTTYDRWQELTGQVKLNGRTLRETLRNVIQSGTYQQLPVESTHAVESPRIPLLRRIVSRYRRAAWNRLLREQPELRAAWRRVQQQRRDVRRGATRRYLPGVSR